ncbi:MAG: SpaH/EbpB family LPXTG-anchored major pilin [Eubacteriales bacterium]|nr:SpaH/EbpB family LPXTG-anchored major pilin [Eubacteriales bacterium]
MKKKLLTLFMVLAMILTISLPKTVGAIRVFEDEEEIPNEQLVETNLTIHKILLAPEKLKNHNENKKYDPSKPIGNIQEFFDDTTAKEISGVYFVVLEVDDENIGKARSGDFSFLEADEEAYIHGVTVNGQVKFEALPDGDYEIFEVKEKSTYVSEDGAQLAAAKAVPIKITLPLINEYGRIEDVHVYPKNTEDKPSVDKDVTNLGNKHDTFNYDEKHTWLISGMIPTDIQKYKVYNFTDILDTSLDYAGNVKVYVVDPEVATALKPEEIGKLPAEKMEELVVNKDYTLTEPTTVKPKTDTPETERTLKIDLITNLNGPEYNTLEKHVGKKLVITFDTTINKNAIMGQVIPNDVTLKYGHNPKDEKDKKPDTPPEVHTGGKRFKKVDNDTVPKGLEGAKFKVIKKIKLAGTISIVDHYLQNDYTWSAKNTAEDMVLKSGLEGDFEIKGLQYGDYELVEIEAPKGFKRIASRIPFTVNETSYYKNPMAVELGTPENLQEQLMIKNEPMDIPLTGGIGTVIFTVGGLLLMAGAVFAIKRRRSMED